MTHGNDAEQLASRASLTPRVPFPTYSSHRRSEAPVGDVSCQWVTFSPDASHCFLFESLRPQAGNHPVHGRTQASQ